MLCIYEILLPQLTEGFAGMHIHFGQARWISSKLFVCFFKTVFFLFLSGFGDFCKKNSSFRLPYQRPSSFAHCTRELFSGSNGSASLIDCTRKKFFCLGGAVFF